MTRSLILLLLALSCGLEPFPPFGCGGIVPICICDNHGNCTWIWPGCG